MEYAIISFSVGEKFYHGYFMRYYLFFTGRMELLIPCLFFIGIRELKVRQIDHNKLVS